MNIMIAINDAYTIPACVMLESFFSHNGRNHTIYLLYKNLKQDHLHMVQTQVEAHGGRFVPMLVDDSFFQGKKLTFHFSIEMYYRLLVYRTFPREVERLLWLDSDIVVNGSIENFYDQELKDTEMIVACKDASDLQEENKRRVGLEKDKLYFNSGVILFHLKTIRERINDEILAECFTKLQERLLWPDQDILNVIYENSVKIADWEQYNCQIFGLPYSGAFRRHVKKNARIIHYVGSEKPWKTGYASSMDVLYLQQYAKLRFLDACKLFCSHRILWVREWLKR